MSRASVVRRAGLGRSGRAEKSGLADWGQSPERITQLRDKVDINIFTPGSKAGIPVSILSSLEVPPFEIMDDGELLGERIESTVSSLLSLIGVTGDTSQSSETVLLSAIFQHAWKAEQDITLESLIRHIQKPSFDKVGVVDLESFFSQKERQALALKFNNLLASPGFATWLEGPPLDIAKMLFQIALAVQPEEGGRILEYDTTVVVPPGWSVQRDAAGTLVLAALAMSRVKVPGEA